MSDDKWRKLLWLLCLKEGRRMNILRANQLVRLYGNVGDAGATKPLDGISLSITMDSLAVLGGESYDI